MLITGGTGRVGEGIVQRFAAAGVPLVFTYQENVEKAQRIETALRDAGHRVHAVAMDMSDIGSIHAALDRVIAEFGSLHGVACGAGPVVPFDKIADFPLERVERFVNRDALGYYRIFHAAIPMLRQRGGGSLTTCSTIATRRVVAYDGMSALSKGSVDALVRQVAAEEAENGIRCNGVAFGWVETRSGAEARAETPMERPKTPSNEAERVTVMMHQFFDIVRIGRPVTPEEAGDTFAFLASNQAKHLTGQVLALDGGGLL
jgi:NAD(P)-dependent dehydrogenase (short-subunit alcohol dehydrogenase family)